MVKVKVEKEEKPEEKEELKTVEEFKEKPDIAENGEEKAENGEDKAVVIELEEEKSQEKCDSELDIYFFACLSVCIYPSYTAMSTISAEVIVMSAFQQHRIKDVSRSQLTGALSSLCSPQTKRKYRSADKASLILPVAKSFLEKGIVALCEDANIANLQPNQVNKVGTF